MMYNPAHFAEKRPEVLAEAIRRFPLATLVTVGRGLRPRASLIPLLWFAEEGVLKGHMARGNGQWRDTMESSEALALFQGPQHYITPSWYAAKREHGKVVPTWNYLAIEARGKIAWHEEAEWLEGVVRALTDAQEGSRELPWKVDDAPREYIAGLLKGIVGIEFRVESMEGKWKMSQNRDAADRREVVAGLEETGSSEAREVADRVRATLEP